VYGGVQLQQIIPFKTEAEAILGPKAKNHETHTGQRTLLID